ncbi:MAG: FecR domain-containing protein [Sphingobium sp.]
MTREQEGDIERDAADWHAQVSGGKVDWDAFARWLDEAPTHQPAYDRLALLDAEVSDWIRDHGMPEVAEEPIAVPRTMSRRWWIGGAVAASLLALVIGVPRFAGPSHDAPLVYATADDQRTIELSGSGKIRLDQRSQLALVANGQVRFDHGAAYFDLDHDDNRPIQIQSGEFTVRDIGTRFTVTRDRGRLFVAVEQGLVDISWQDSSPVHLAAGQTFQGDERTGSGDVGKVEVDAVWSSRNGQLVYDETPLTQVAADLSRYTNKPVEVEPAIAHLKLSGVLIIRNGPDLVDQITAILPVEARRSDDRIRLVSRARR